jgi:hypothetical protein
MGVFILPGIIRKMDVLFESQIYGLVLWGNISEENSKYPYSGGYGDFLQKFCLLVVDLYKADHIVIYLSDYMGIGLIIGFVELL